MTSPATTILVAARRTLAADPTAPIARIVAEAGVSRATFYRCFGSRAALLEALDLEPDPDTGERILAAAIDLLTRDGLRALSMDEVAERAGVSRASVYRRFPGKTALFAALVDVYSPFKEVSAEFKRHHDDPPEIAIPALLHAVARFVAPRISIIRSMMLEVSAGTPEAVEAAQAAARPLFAESAAYFARQAAAGRIRPMHPLLAAQTAVGPLMFYLLTQPFAGPVSGLELTPDEAADAIATVALHGLLS